VPSWTTPPVALTIAGSDSGGGAGLQADLKTFAAHQVHGASVVTAVTAQSTVEVRGVVAMDPDFVILQLETVLDDLAVQGVKTGMLATPGIVKAVAEIARDGRLPRLVVDPVLVSSTGHALMEPDGVGAYLDELVPNATIFTPNLREAALLLGREVAELASPDAMIAAAEALRGFGARYVVLKGGHLQQAAGSPGPVGSPDVVAGPKGTRLLDGERVPTPNDHGTGCSMAAAIAARLARGEGEVEAIEGAKSFVARGLAGAAQWRLGRGHGPIDHFGWSTP
jgi:hydroxymethylpyrimidine/phosphomethylpyrimidine kinase